MKIKLKTSLFQIKEIEKLYEPIKVAWRRFSWLFQTFGSRDAIYLLEGYLLHQMVQHRDFNLHIDFGTFYSYRSPPEEFARKESCRISDFVMCWSMFCFPRILGHSEIIGMVNSSWKGLEAERCFLGALSAFYTNQGSCNLFFQEEAETWRNKHS